MAGVYPQTEGRVQNWTTTKCTLVKNITQKTLSKPENSCFMSARNFRSYFKFSYSSVVPVLYIRSFPSTALKLLEQHKFCLNLKVHIEVSILEVGLTVRLVKRPCHSSLRHIARFRTVKVNPARKLNQTTAEKLNRTTGELPFGWVFGFQLGLRQTQAYYYKLLIYTLFFFS